MTRRTAAAALALALVAAPTGVDAHPLRTGYLELQQTGPDAYRVLWSMPGLAADASEIRLEFPPGCAAASEPATSAEGERTVRTWSIRCPGGLTGEIAASGLAADQADILVRVVRADGGETTGRLAPLAPALALPETPGVADFARAYLALGVEHILLGVDHLLFVTALMLLIRGLTQLLATITAFTVAHSLTLAVAVLGLLRVPGPPVEALIPLSIALAAAAGWRQRRGADHAPGRQSGLIAFIFGLMHGLGFAGALGELGLPPGSVPTALLFFNLGVEAGQLAFVAVLLAAAAAWRKLPWPWPRWTAGLPAYAIGSLAMFWTVERIAAFWG